MENTFRIVVENMAIDYNQLRKDAKKEMPRETREMLENIATGIYFSLARMERMNNSGFELYTSPIGNELEIIWK